ERVDRRGRSPGKLGQMAKHLTRTLAPFMAQCSEIRVATIESTTFLQFEAVSFVANQVDRHAHRQVAAHGRIERHQHTLRGLCKGSRARNHAVDDRLAVLRLTGLKLGCVDSCFDEIALGIDPEQPWPLTVDLPTDDEGSVEAELVLLQVLTVASLDIAHRVADYHEHADHRLGSGEVSGAQQHDNAVAGAVEHRHLAELGEVVHAGMRTGVRGENHSLFKQYAYTVGHA